ncbi:MAG: hypothetical protein ABSH34_18015 [Verrucomicrobiota bacterium]|jgi:hypothetical protein
MNAKEQFALALRIIGVLSLMYILRTFIRNPSPKVAMLIVELACAAIGVCFIRGMPSLVKFAYPDSEPSDKAKV